VLTAVLALSGCVRGHSTVSPTSAQWIDRTVLRCEATTATTTEARLREELRRLPLPDSAAAVELALDALGARGTYPNAVVEVYARAPNGILIAFDLVGRARTAGTRDGTATVYVSPGHCVTLLGW
jgi:hypothetical protein